MQLIVLLSRAVYWGKIFSIFFPLVMLYGIYFTFLGYELEEKQYNIFPPGPVFYLLVTEKLVQKSMGERKMYFFPFPYFSPMDHAVFGTEVHENDDIFFFLYIFWRARMCRPLLCLCRPFMIFEGYLDSNPECCRSKLARYRLSHPSRPT